MANTDWYRGYRMVCFRFFSTFRLGTKLCPGRFCAHTESLRAEQDAEHCISVVQLDHMWIMLVSARRAGRMRSATLGGFIFAAASSAAVSGSLASPRRGARTKPPLKGSMPDSIFLRFRNGSTPARHTQAISDTVVTGHDLWAGS